MKWNLLLLIIGIALPSFFYAQNTNAVSGDNAEYEFSELDEQPQFQGGTDGLVKYLSENIKYPKKAEKKGITGKVYVQFIIDKTGKVVDVVAINGIEKSLDKEAIRVIKTMPKWKPAMKNGNPVKVKYTIPISFKL